MKLKQGRPPVAEENRRTARVMVRYTEAERLALAALAEHNGETLSDLVRRLTTRQLSLV